MAKKPSDSWTHATKLYDTSYANEATVLHRIVRRRDHLDEIGLAIQEDNAAVADRVEQKVHNAIRPNAARRPMGHTSNDLTTKAATFWPTLP